MQQLEHQVLAYIQEKQLITPGDRLLIACSGGVDSMALLCFFNKFKQTLNIEIVVAHVDHMLRGNDSHGDRLFVENYCQQNEIQVESCAIPIAEIAGESGGNLQAICRRERYRFLQEVMERRSLTKLVTAHHADDQLESMLMALTKSGVLNGFKGIQPKRNFFEKVIIRPFLAVTKEDIREYLQENSGTFREDASNAKEGYTRNRFRHRIVPLLKEENHNVSSHAVQLVDQISQDDDYLNELARQQFQVNVEKNSNNSYVFDINAFQNEPPALQRRLILILLNYLYNDSNTIQSYALCTSILKLFETLEGSVTINLPEGFIARREYTRVIFEKDHSQYALAPQQLALNGWNDLGQMRVYIGILSGSDLRLTGEETVYYFCATTMRFPLFVRARQDGDRIAQKGMQQLKKVSRIFIDEKIPLVERNRWPLLLDDDNDIMAVLAIRVNDKFSKVKRPEDDYILVIEPARI